MKLKPGTPEEAGMSPARVKHVRELARSWVEDGTHHALVVLVARRGIIAFHEAFGTLTPEPGSRSLSLDAIFPITSTTKPVTAAAIMCLVEDGRIGLMRPVRDYYPEIAAEGTEEVLIHHVLTHLSGWSDLGIPTAIERLQKEGGAPSQPEPGQHPDLAGLPLLMSTLPLASRPNEVMQYCNLNYELLADLLRRVSGTPIERFAQERIFEPLGMTDSSYVLLPEHRERKVRRGEGMPGFEALGPRPGMDSEQWEGTPSGYGGMHATARDIAIFAQMLLNGGTYDGQRVLSNASVQAMRRNQVPDGVPVRFDRRKPDGTTVTLEFSGGGYGYGLFPFLHRSATAYMNGGLSSPSSFGHSGFGGPYFWVDPERDLVGVYLSVVRQYLEDEVTFDSRSDIFVDTVTAAVED